MDNEDLHIEPFTQNSNPDQEDKAYSRLTAVALYMLSHSTEKPPSAEDNWSFGSSYFDQIKIGVIKYGHGGLIHALVNDNRIILLPRITNNDQCHVIYGNLLSFFHHDPHNIKWIIDCSSLIELPILLLSNLIAYAHKLRSRGSDLYLCWFKPEFIPEQQRNKICDFFHLELRCGYLFAKMTN